MGSARRGCWEPPRRCARRWRSRPAGDRDLIATSLANLASVALRRRDVVQAETLGREALAEALGEEPQRLDQAIPG